MVATFLTCSQKTDRQPASSTTRDQKRKRINDKKIQQTDEHNKSSLSSKRQSRGEVPEVYGGKTCEKGRFWAESEKEKKLRRVEMMMMYMNCYECEGDWLVDWRNEIPETGWCKTKWATQYKKSPGGNLLV